MRKAGKRGLAGMMAGAALVAGGAGCSSHETHQLVRTTQASFPLAGILKTVENTTYLEGCFTDPKDGFPTKGTLNFSALTASQVSLEFTPEGRAPEVFPLENIPNLKIFPAQPNIIDAAKIVCEQVLNPKLNVNLSEQPYFTGGTGAAGETIVDATGRRDNGKGESEIYSFMGPVNTTTTIATVEGTPPNLWTQVTAYGQKALVPVHTESVYP